MFSKNILLIKTTWWEVNSIRFLDKANSLFGSGAYVADAQN